MLAADATLNRAGIAQVKGVSRARVTQVMNLLRLPKRLQTMLLNVASPEQLHHLTERRLRPIITCSAPEVQRRRVQELVAALGHKTHR